MWFCFGIGLLVGCGLMVVADIAFFNLTGIIYEYVKCKECNNFPASICRECSTELSKR
jgi:hypothetical protein